MVIKNTYPNLSNIVHTDFELGRVMYTVTALQLARIIVPTCTCYRRERFKVESTREIRVSSLPLPRPLYGSAIVAVVPVGEDSRTRHIDSGTQ